MMRSVNGLTKVGLVIPGEISAEQTGSIWLNICNSPRRAKDLELNAELCIAGRSDIISPVCGQFVRKSESHRRDLWGWQYAQHHVCSSIHISHTANSTWYPVLRCVPCPFRRARRAGGHGDGGEGGRGRGRRSTVLVVDGWTSGGRACANRKE